MSNQFERGIAEAYQRGLSHAQIVADCEQMIADIKRQHDLWDSHLAERELAAKLAPIEPVQTEQPTEAQTAPPQAPLSLVEQVDRAFLSIMPENVSMEPTAGLPAIINKSFENI